MGLMLICALLVYQGVAFSRVDQWAIGGALVLLAGLALLFGRDAPDEPPQHGGP